MRHHLRMNRFGISPCKLMQLPDSLVSRGEQRPFATSEVCDPQSLNVVRVSPRRVRWSLLRREGQPDQQRSGSRSRVVSSQKLAVYDHSLENGSSQIVGPHQLILKQPIRGLGEALN